MSAHLSLRLPGVTSIHSQWLQLQGKHGRRGDVGRAPSALACAPDPGSLVT